jgi:L-iditol 2-dehydrogenase
VDVASDRLKLAGECSATHTIDSSKQDPLNAILQLTSGVGADLAFEAVGINQTIDLTLRCLRKGSTAVLVGNVSPKIEFPLQVAVTRELNVLGSCASNGEYPACLDMLARGALNAKPLLSASAPLKEGAAWFQRLYSREPGLLKVILNP